MNAIVSTHIFSIGDGQAVITRWADTEARALAIASEFKRDVCVFGVVVLPQAGNVLGDWKITARRIASEDELARNLKVHDPCYAEWETVGVPCSYMHVSGEIRRFQEAQSRLQDFKARIGK